MDPLANVCSNFEQVGQAFVSHYYNTFDANRSHLGQLYKVTITTASLHLLPSELAKCSTHYLFSFWPSQKDEVSMLNFEHSAERPGQYKGVSAILSKIQSLPFQQVKHHVITIDCQPTPGGGVIVMVCGNLLVDAEQIPQKFSQVFQLLPSGNGSFYILNDIFRLNIG
eukprot:31479-Pelagococcus_subviridis.AAC.45